MSHVQVGMKIPVSESSLCLMERCPTEIWNHIFSDACIDNGITGRSLSLVSKYVQETSKSVKLQSLSVHGPKQIIMDLLFCLQTPCQNIEKFATSSFPLRTRTGVAIRLTMKRLGTIWTRRKIAVVLTLTLEMTSRFTVTYIPSYHPFRASRATHRPDSPQLKVNILSGWNRHGTQSCTLSEL